MGASVSRSERLKGARFGQHEIVRLIGHGATASVFEARHVTLGKAVAIKLLHEHMAADEYIASRFLREGQIAARLRHPNALDVIDVGVQDGTPYLVMELLHGSDLRALLADVGVLPIDAALAYLLPIASALAHAHDLGVLHRDLKPANVFLARDVRDDVVPKLVDFGLSKATFDTTASAPTATELVAGTVLYMAPEATLGVRHASPASDQYALAAIVYECLTGGAPFAGEGVYALMEAIRCGGARPPSAINAAIPEALDAAILRALATDPAHRWPSVRAFARAMLPMASEVTSRALERDFVERGSGAGRAAASRPSSGSPVSGSPASAPRSGPDVETRAEVDASSIRPIAPLPCPPGEGPFHIKGISYRGFVHLVSHAAPGGIDAFSAALNDERLASFLRQPFLASGRYDIFPFVPLYATLARMLGIPLETLVRTSTSAQARYDAAGPYKRIFDTKDPTQLCDRISRFNEQYYDFGTFRGALTGDTRVAIEFAAIPAYVAPWFGPMHLAYTEESLKIAGAEEVVPIAQLTSPAGTRDGYALITFRSELRWR